MWMKSRFLPRLPRVLFRLVDSDPLIRDAVTFGSHAIAVGGNSASLPSPILEEGRNCWMSEYLDLTG